MANDLNQSMLEFGRIVSIMPYENKTVTVSNVINHDGSIYNGETMNGLRNGSGLCSYADGSSYDASG